MTKDKAKFLDSFPNAKFRYLDLNGTGKPAVSSPTLQPDLNKKGYDSFFTVNGFEGDKAQKENCTNLTSFFIDIDKKLTPEEIEKIKAILEPTFIVETFHGFHFYWLLDEVIYKDEVFGEETWEDLMARWERIEQNIVSTIKDADKNVKDIPRILRVPDSIYWKKTKGEFKIKGIHKNLNANYSMNQMEEAFPPVEIVPDYSTNASTDKISRYAEAEKKDFFRRVNEEYPIEERSSFQKLVSGAPESLPPTNNSRNQALLVTATLMRQAGWSKEKAVKNVERTGWHGIEKERGGWQEIVSTINSAYNNQYAYSYKNELIAWNMDELEQQKIQSAYMVVQKERKEKDKVRFTNYEREILAHYPHLRKNEVGIVYNYVDGVYKPISDQDVSGIILNGLYEDMLWGYRTTKSVKDKVACLIAIIPDLVITDDKGYIANVKNGLLDIYTRELKPHSPTFVSLIQYPVAYDPQAKCPVWESCMDAWMDGEEKEEKKLMLQQFCGYILSSSMLYDKALFLVGDGGNGKSTFVDTISMIIGRDSTSHIDLESLYSTFGMHGLIGKRLNVIEEVHGNYYQSNKLKKLISGEKVTIDIKYKPQFSFRPQAKFMFAVNIMPRVDDTSTATERRICAVVFGNNFRDNPNTQLRSDGGLLAQELSGILNWMLEGARLLKEKKNFIVTQEQINLLSEYRQENSSVEGFIGECLEFGEGQTISARELYTEYKHYCEKDGRKFKANLAFTKEMKAYGHRYRKFQFIPRMHGHETARFEGVTLDKDWAKEGDYTMNRLNREF